MDMELVLTFVALFATTISCDQELDNNQHKTINIPEETMDAMQLINYFEYPAEEHVVTTDDGYILTIHRIPHGKGMQSGEKRPVMFLMHGMDCASTNWITNFPHQSAGFIFADAGYDVWMGNFRGNLYSKRHVNMSSSTRQFWEFDYDQMAQYDLETMINFALNTSGQESLYYVGYSMGTLAAFAKFSDDLQFARKVRIGFYMAPIMSNQHMSGAMKYMAPLTNNLQYFLVAVGNGNFFPRNWFINFLAKFICGWGATDKWCSNLIFLMAGKTTDQLNMTRLPVYLEHTPAGTSTQTVLHFGQMYHSNNFSKYDYGAEKNQQRYGQTSPPLYPAEKMEVPTVLFYSADDDLADAQDVKEGLIPRVKNLLGNHELTDFSHTDWIWGLKAADQVYSKILSTIRENPQY